MDLSFLLGGAGGAVQMPDPVLQYSTAMSLAQLARQNRVGDLAEREQARKLEEEDAYRQALPALLQAGFSRDAVLQAIQADPRIGPRAIKEADDRVKAKADLAKTEAGTLKDSVEAKSKAFNDIASVAYAEAQNPNPSLSRVKRVADFYGVPLPPLGGDDPESLRGYIQSLADAGISVKDQIAVKQKDRDWSSGEIEKLWRREFDTGKQAETERHNRSSEGLIARGQNMTDSRAREFNATAREGVQATRDAARDTKINSETQALAKMTESTALPNLITSATELDKTIGKYAGVRDMPGVGIADANMPALLRSAEGNKVRSQIQAVANDLLKLYSGGAVTANEAERRATEMMASGQFNETDLRNAWPLVKGRINAAVSNVRAGFSPEAVDTYEKRGGLKLRPIEGAQASEPAKPKLGEKRDGYIYKGGDPSKQESWEKL